MDIAYIQVDKNLIQEFSENISYNFSENETITKTLKVTGADLQPLFSSWIEQSFPYSYVAKDLKKDKVVGGLLCNDFTFFLNTAGPEVFSLKIHAVTDLLSTLENRFIKQFPGSLKEKNYLYHYALYVDKEYSNKGIATSLYTISQKNAQEKGFKNIIAILTGLISQHIYLNKLGFKKIDELIYKDFCFQGKHLLSNVEPKTCVLAIRDLDHSLLHDSK